MTEDNRLNLVEGTGINLAKDDQARTLTIKTTVNNVELTSPNDSIDIHSSVDSETNTKTFTLDVNGGGESGENTVLESPNNSINITSAYDAQTNTRTFNIDVNGGGTGEKIILQSEDQSLYITDTHDQSTNTTTYDFKVMQQSDWAETDSNSGTFIQNKPIAIFTSNDAYSAVTNAVNAGKLVMKDSGYVYSKTKDNVHYFTKLDYVENEAYPGYIDKAMYEIVSVGEDNNWITHIQSSSLISEDYLKGAFTGPIWDIYEFGGKEVYSVRLTQCPLYIYERYEGPEEQQVMKNLDADGLSAITISNNKLTKVVNVNTSTLEILVPCASDGAGEHAPNFVVELNPDINCIINVNKAKLNHDETIVGSEPLYYTDGSTSAAVTKDIRYQLKGTGSYWSLTDYGPIPTPESTPESTPENNE